MPSPALTPVSRSSVPDSVAAQLQDQILDGALEPGADLPGERALAEALGVSRPTVREALRRLQQQGLVEIRQGGATTVRDFRRTAGLDLLPRLLRARGGIDLDVVADVMQARSAIGPQVAVAAARAAGGDPAGASGLLAAADAVAAAAADADPVAQQRAALAFWDAVVDLTGSMVYRLLYNGLRRAFEPALAAMAGVLSAEVGDGSPHRALASAIADGDPEPAERAAAALLATGQQAVQAAIDRVRSADADHGGVLPAPPDPELRADR